MAFLHIRTVASYDELLLYIGKSLRYKIFKDAACISKNLRVHFQECPLYQKVISSSYKPFLVAKILRL